MRTLLKQALLTTVGRATRRTAVLLPKEAGWERGILAVVAPYRVTDAVLQLQVCHDGGGDMRVVLTGDAAATPAGCAFGYDGVAPLSLDLRTGALACGSMRPGSLTGGAPVTARRFSLDLVLVEPSGDLRRRITSHYLPRDGQLVDERYYAGEDYVNYEAESAATHEQVLDLVRRHHFAGPVLEIGCATGGTLTALRAAGYDPYGLDFSAWAIERARARLGDTAWRCDVEREPWPAEAVARAPFKCFVLAAVLEHFARPRDVLRRLAPLAAADAGLIIVTTNASSLTHRLLGPDWEGYFDWTHQGVDLVCPNSLRQWLAESGWRVRELRTWHVWDGSTDPTHATLRDWHAADARMRALLAERELGDFIACVAERA